MPVESAKDVLTEVLRKGVQQMLAETIEGEAADWIEAHALERVEGGKAASRGAWLKGGQR